MNTMFLAMQVCQRPATALCHSEVSADACNFGTNAALLHEGRLIAFSRKQYNPVKRNYGVGEQELLAAVHATRA